MIELILIVVGLLIISFTCSVLESVILSMTRSYIHTMIEKGHRAGHLLSRLKNKIDEPISAILTLNTISHTVGATISGATALQIFGNKWMALFSAVLTFLILIFSEIIPKTLGAYYWKRLGPFTAYILRGIVFLLKPLIVPVNYLSKLIAKENPSAIISKAEVINYIRLGYFQGAIQSPEFEIIENLFELGSLKVKDIMTPRTVVFWLPPEHTIEDIIKNNVQLEFSRIPLYNANENRVEGILLRREVMNHIIKQKIQTELKSLARPPEFVLETNSIYKLLNQMISKKIHLAVVINEYGDYTGIVAMEDAIETVLGKEIVDEFDTTVDMRKLAKEKSSKKYKQ